ncbi:PLP-dependent aminotransferase family protein [Paenibacillus sp. NPDC058071]|uniref:MocR-like pyridoxine biosynthesis transcription factor PdxR n=1 Tax=Paenibacillus sp. NPDC058071 TaxID=3346326 RepID=UPI0036DE16A4
MNSSDSKTKQIYTMLREKIVAGHYPSRSRLPSTRDLADEFGVSRALMVEVYEQLIAEGYLEGRQGSGTYVMELGSHMERLLTKPPSVAIGNGGTVADKNSKQQIQRIDFRPSFPALNHFPLRKWKETLIAAHSELSVAELGYEDDPAGDWELRNGISRMLYHTKGITCSPNQIIVTAGATQAISLLSRLLLHPGDTVALENPTATFIRRIFESSGADLIPVPVDEQGLRVEELPQRRYPKCIFVTPSHQFPLGSILSIGRRLELLEYAQAAGSYIIEDDYDSEFRYVGMPVRALRELDDKRVIYVGTFSKNMFPALRFGYMVVPYELLDALLELKQIADMNCPKLSQKTLAKFIADGHLEQHVARMRRLYSKRRKCLIHSLTDAFGEDVSISGDAAGLHLVMELSGSRFDPQRIAQIEEQHIRLYPAESYILTKDRTENRLIMGFGNVDERQIKEGVQIIAHLINQ